MLTIFEQGNYRDVHCIGNGNITAYIQNSDILQVFGPYLSVPFLIGIVGEGTVKSARQNGTAVWDGIAESDGREIYRFKDFTDKERPIMIRMLDMREKTVFQIQKRPDSTCTHLDGILGQNSSCMYELPVGACVFAKVVTEKDSCTIVTVAGNAAISEDGASITFLPGKSVLYIACGEFRDSYGFMRSVLTEDTEKILQETVSYWNRFTSRRYDFNELLPQGLVLREEILQMIDDVSICIKTQQDREGGIIAGHMYHLAYVRDNFGISKCLLKLGYFEEVKSLLEFYFNKFRQYGHIENAQAVRGNGFHGHENDNVELTGYLACEIFDYCDASGDHDFVLHILPLLKWTLEMQNQYLYEGMLPFNGDETYVAGGILPRKYLNHGSSESTMLFASALRRMLDFHERFPCLTEEEKIRYTVAYREITETYYRNFWRDGKLLTNNIRYLGGGKLPEVRYGVCEKCNKLFTWLIRDPHKHYCCPSCYPEPTTDDRAEYYLNCVSLTACLCEARLIKNADLKTLVKNCLIEVDETKSEGKKFVGYEYALLLNAMHMLGVEGAKDIVETIMGMRDETGTYAEYYRYADGGFQPSGCKYRPWESALNLYAILASVVPQ